MIGDGNCDTDCTTAACGYDAKDCGCAPGCTFDMYDSCDFQCLVPDCQYDDCWGYNNHIISVSWQMTTRNLDTAFDFWNNCESVQSSCGYSDMWDFVDQRTCNPNCDQCINAFGTCYYGGHEADCSYAFGPGPGQCILCDNYNVYTYCTNSCPRAMPAHSMNWYLCYPATDTSSASSPGVMYVTNTNTGQNEGTWNQPYFQLASALAQNYQAYTTVYLLEGTHQLLPVDTTSLEGLLIEHASDILTNGYSNAHLLITTLMCTGSNDHPSCASSAATLHLADLSVKFTINSFVTFSNVRFDGATQLPPACAGDLCSYCPLVDTNEEDVLVDDRGQEVTVGTFTPQTVCNAYHTSVLFMVKSAGSLTLSDVEVVNIRYQLKAVIYSQGGTITLSAVTFSNIIPSINSGAVIMQETCASSYGCGSLTYTSGTVSYLNNGYEVGESLEVGGFLYADGLRDISFTSVNFVKNIAVNPKVTAVATGLIALKNFRTVTFDSCTFRSNLVTVLIAVKAPALSLVRSVDSSNQVIDFAITHIYFKSTVFDKNLAETSLLSTNHAKDMQNVHLESCQFTNNVAAESSLIALSYTGKMTTDITDGWTKAVALPNGSKVQGYFSPRFVRIESTTFTGNLGLSLFTFTTMANIKIWNSVLITSNGASQTQTYNDFIVSEFISDSNAYLKLPIRDGSISPCQQLLSFQSCIGVTVTGTTFNANFCNDGLAGIEAAKTSKALSLSSLTFTGNSAVEIEGTVLAVTDTTLALSFSNLVFSGNKNTHGAATGIAYFGPGLSVTLADCRFSSNEVASGAGIYAKDTALLSASATIFESNQAMQGSGGAIYADVGSGTAQYSFTLQACTFLSNKSGAAKGGGVFVTSRNLARPYKITVTGSTFTSNSAATLGAALYIEATIVLSADSSLQTCSFTQNTCQKGTIAVYYHSGTLAINDCKFTSNTANIGPGVFATIQTAALLTLSSTSFTSNTSPVGVVALLDLDIVKTLITVSCLFQSNKGIAVAVENVKWTDTKSTFSQNTDSALDLADASIVTMTAASFVSNLSVDHGGAAYLSTAAVFKCSKCAFTRNFAKDKGGAVFMEQASQIQISESAFESNSCNDKGAAIFILGSITPVSTVLSTSFTSNSASNSGVISLLSSSLSLTSVTINSNTARGLTPGIVLNLSTLSVTSSFFSNHQGSQGGFLYATTESSAVFTDTSFSAGSAESGGAFNIVGSNLTVTNSRLDRISALSGAGFIAYSKCFVWLDLVTMSYMSASDSAIGLISEGTLTVKNSQFAYFGSGGIQADKLTAAYIVGSQFSYGTGVLGGAFSCTRCKNVIIQNSVFTRNSANWGGGLYLTTQSDSVVSNQYLVEYTTFTYNTAWRGGGAFSNNINIKYNNCSFESNNATLPEDHSTGDWGRGGAVLPDCKDMPSCIFNFTACYFAANHADVSGGALAWQDVRPNVTQTTFRGNTAEYAADISSFAVSIQQVTGSKRRLEGIALSNLASGQVATQSLMVALVDHYGNVVTTDNSSSAELVAVDVATTTVSGVSKVTAVQGIFTFDKYIISAEPGTTAQVRVSTSAIDTSKATKALDSVLYAPAISVSAEMRNCIMGESHVGVTCQICEPGKYSLDPNSTACTNCPNEAICYGNYTMVPRAGYWRARADTEVFYKCLYVSACTGSPTPPNSLSLTGDCATGYTGNLCESCQNGYSRSSKYECARCPDQDINTVRLVFIALAVAILVGIMVSTTIKSAVRTKSLSSIYIKILMNYLQIVILAASFNLAWPEQVLQLFSAQESAGSFTEQAFSVDCFLAPSDSANADIVVFRKLIVMAVLPVFLAAVSCVIWVCIQCYKRYDNFPRDSLIATMVILLFLAHPTLTKYLFNIFTCMDIDGKMYLLQQLDVKCWDYTHVFYIVTCAMPAIILWVLGVPALCLAYLVKNKKNLFSIAIRIRLGFLFNGYRPHAYYWEFVILYRKIAIICCSVFLTTISIPIQALCVLFVLILALYVQDQVQPYTTKDLNSIELKSILCATVTIYCGLFFLTGDLGDSAKMALFVAIVVTNVFFLWHWGRKMFGFYITLVINKVPVLRRQLGYINKVKDGLDEDLFVRRHKRGAFGMLNEGKDFTPMLAKREAALSSMQELYELKLQEVGKEEEREEETLGMFTTASPRHLNSFSEEVRNTQELESARESQADAEALVTH